MAQRLRRIILGFALIWSGGALWAADFTVYGAASLRGALDEVAEAWEAETEGRLTLVYAGSSALARQIEAGAQADLAILANVAWMDHLEAAGRLRDGGRVDLLRNRLVVIAGARDTSPLDLTDPGALSARLEHGRLALTLTEAVPAGIYAREALVHLGLWDGVSARVVEADNVRAALALVALGAADLGVVYATDALAEPRVAILAEFPPQSHAPIIYPAALVEGGGGGAEALLNFLQGPAARAIFRSHGFGLAVGD